MEFTLKAQLSARQEALSLVASASRLVGPARSATPENGNMDLSDPFDAELVTAFSEVFNNIVKHSYREAADQEIRVSIERGDDFIRISTTDFGSPFEFESVEEPLLQTLPETGLGIHIAKECLDELQYHAGPPNVWTLSKRYQTSSNGEPVNQDSPRGANS